MNLGYGDLKMETQINPEFGSVTAAESLAKQYGFAVTGLSEGVWRVTVWIGTDGLSIDASSWPKGLYTLRFEREGLILSKRVVKP